MYHTHHECEYIFYGNTFMIKLWRGSLITCLYDFDTAILCFTINLNYGADEVG